MSCVICFQDNAHNVELNCACKVNFCEGCILRWLQENSTCPTCRSLLTITGKAEELTERGMAFFATAQESGFHDKPALKEASNLFLRAIAADRSKPQPLVCMGYLLLLLNNQEMARRYLDEAVRVDPANEDAKKLLGACA